MGEYAGWAGDTRAPAGRGCTGPGLGPVGDGGVGLVGAVDHAGAIGVKAVAISATRTPAPRPQPPTLLLVECRDDEDSRTQPGFRGVRA